MAVDAIATYEQWAGNAVRLRTRARWYLFGTFYSLARAFGWQFSITRAIFGFLRLLSSLAVTAAPVLMKSAYSVIAPSNGKHISWTLVIAATAVIVLLLLYNKAYDYLVRRNGEQRTIKRQRESLANRLANATAKLASADLNVNGINPTDKSRLIEDLLRCILYEARLVIGHFDENFLEASMLQFDSDLKNIEVTYRAIRDRPTNSVKPAAETMAYYVAKNQSDRVINSFKRDHPFPKHGLSSQTPSYKSILLVPIIYLAPDQHYLCPAVVTIDSDRPYEFWGGRGNRIVIQARPYLNLLRMLVNDAPALEV